MKSKRPPTHPLVSTVSVSLDPGGNRTLHAALLLNLLLIGVSSAATVQAAADCDVPDPPPVCGPFEPPEDPDPVPNPPADPLPVPTGEADRPDYDADGRTDMTVWRPSDGYWHVLTSSSGYASAISRQWGAPSDIPLADSDFDGDGRADMAVWRPSDGNWHVLTSSSGYASAISRQWGSPGDVPLADSDFDGDGRADMAVWRPSDGNWHVLTSSSDYDYAATISRKRGQTGDIPLAHSDFDGDGRADMAVWRPSNGTWYLLPSALDYSLDFATSSQWGQAGDIPLADSDFDGDGRADMAVWRPSSGMWNVLTSGSGYSVGSALSRQWGEPSDVPLTDADFDGDGRADMAVWRPSNGTWYVLTSASGYSYGSALTRQWGAAGDMPLMDADFDGDGRSDMAVWRPSDGTWYVQTSSSNWSAAVTRQWGTAGDIPMLEHGPSSPDQECFPMAVANGVTRCVRARPNGTVDLRVSSASPIWSGPYLQADEPEPNYCGPTALKNFLSWYDADDDYATLGGEMRSNTWDGLTVYAAVVVAGAAIGCDPLFCAPGVAALVSNYLVEAGTLPGDMLGALQRRAPAGYVACIKDGDSSRENFRASLAQGNPVVFLESGGSQNLHWATATGIRSSGGQLRVRVDNTSETDWDSFSQRWSLAPAGDDATRGLLSDLFGLRPYTMLRWIPANQAIGGRCP